MNKKRINDLTGGTGNAIFDGSMRGLFTLAALGFLAFLNDKLDWLTADDVTNLTPVVTALCIFGWGVYDHFVRPRLQ